MATRTQMDLNLDTLFEVAQKYYNETEQKKIIDLYRKWMQREGIIGFTGHFSAGKSSMINHLLNCSILPSSPIPTSANIVEIKQGNDRVTYHLNHQRYAITPAIEMEEVQRLSKNGDDVQSITIETDLPFLNETTLMDTPGIDSADDDEFARTLSRIHLIDYFVYVVDYNHVQSEVNFQFLNELEIKSVPYIIVVNQVDKHNNEEMTMEDYLQALRESCQDWNLNPDAIFTTSLIQIDHEYNQLDDLKDYMNQLTDTIKTQLDSRLKVEVEEMIEHLADRYYSDTNQSLDKADEQAYEKQFIELNDQLKLLDLDQKQFTTQYKQKIGKIIIEAHVMTADIREVAKEYLETLHPKFKVGGLFSSRKTAEEKERRRDHFLKQLQERITTEINWHVRHTLLETYNHQSLNNNELKQTLQQFDFQVNESILLESHNPSAKITGQYVLNYTENLQANLNQHIKQDVTYLLERLFEEITRTTEEKRKQLQEELKAVQDEWNHAQKTNQETLEKKQLVDYLKRETWWSSSEHPKLLSALENQKETQTHVEIDEINSNSRPKLEASDAGSSHEVETVNIDDIHNQAELIIKRLETIPLLHDSYDSIQKQLDQLDQQQYTIALFGAFSAGKSSFANAWVGESLLPVSPNPTTAAINKIAPATSSKHHGVVSVQFKTEETIIYQVSKLLEPVTDKQFNTLDQLYAFINKQQNELETMLTKTDWSFIAAFLKGRENCERYLSHELMLNTENFQSYVTDETLSCYVEEITVHYDCALTQQGVTLVDTPGADSIHARHTNVSMHYVRHSDVIVYVNYYNHAFARADREFLSQLGRIKSSFSLDKMFFILNAADLAKDDQELSSVQHYLAEQLQQYGIESPQIFPISSRRLNEDVNRKHSDQQALAFFGRFQRFIETDAKTLTAQTLQEEIDNLFTFIKQTVLELDQNQSEQEECIQQYEAQYQNLQEHLKSCELTVYEQQINQQIDELIHYLNERVMIQLNEIMKDAINPTTVNEKGKRGQKQLKQAIKQLIINFENRLDNEFHSTNMILDGYFQYVVQSIAEDTNHFLETYTEFDRLTIAKQAMTEANYDEMNSIVDTKMIEQLVVMYKDQKQFFVEQQVSTLFDQLKSHVQSNLDEIQTQFLTKFKSHYHEQIKLVFEMETSRYLATVRQMIESKQQLYGDEIQADQLRELYNELN